MKFYRSPRPSRARPGASWPENPPCAGGLASPRSAGCEHERMAMDRNTWKNIGYVYLCIIGAAALLFYGKAIFG